MLFDAATGSDNKSSNAEKFFVGAAAGGGLVCCGAGCGAGGEVRMNGMLPGTGAEGGAGAKGS